MVAARTFGRGNEEDEVGGSVGRTEVGLRGQPGETERRRGHRFAACVRDRDPAGKAGGGLGLPFENGRGECVGVGCATVRCETLGERGDDGVLVGSQVYIERDEFRADDRGTACGAGGGVGHDVP